MFINPGLYDVEYTIRASPRFENFSDQVIVLDIFDSKKLEKLSEYNFTSNDAGYGEWSTVTLQVHVEYRIE